MSTSALPTPASTSRSGEPRLSPAAIVALGDGLIAISNELHTTAAAESHSLNGWLEWLEDEGYDGRPFVEALQGLCRQQLDDAAYAQLQATASARADQPEGMQQAIDHLNERHPALLDEILQIEQTRQEELQVLNARAGGVNMKKVGIHTAEAAGAALVGFGVYKIVQRCRRPAEREVLRGDDLARAAARNADQELRGAVTNVVETSPDPREVVAQESRVAAERMRAVQSGQPFDIGKKASEIAETDLLDVAKNYSSAHVAQVESYTKVIMQDETTKLFHGSTDLKKVLREHTVQALKEDSSLMDLGYKDADAYADHLIETRFKGDLQLLEGINSSESFQAAYEKARTGFQEGLSNNLLRGPINKKLTDEYRKLITAAYNDDKTVKEMLGEAEDNVYQFRSELKPDILDELRLNRVPIEGKIDMFCVGRVRKEAADFEDYLENQKDHLDRAFEQAEKEDAESFLERQAREEFEVIDFGLENKIEKKVESTILEADQVAKDIARNVEDDASDAL